MMISGIILAAGMSTRMGEPKALLDWGGQPLICYQVRQLQEAGVDEVIVVLGYRADDVQRQMRQLKCRVMLNPRYQMGRAASLRIGAKAANRDADAILILNVDSPRPAAFLKSLIEAHKPDSVITRPVFQGRHGHPIVVNGGLRPELLAVEDNSGGLRAVVEAHRSEINDLPSDASCEVEFNTPEEYEAARRFFGVLV